MPGNIIAGFNIAEVGSYYAGNHQAVIEYLALHEVAHESAAGVYMDSHTPSKEYNDFTPGTANWANENFANTVALATMEAVALNLQKYDPVSGTLTVTGRWQTNNIWTVNHE
jgi:hypothetical protein